MADLCADQFTPSDVARFTKKIQINPQNECWEWQASRDRQGYGEFAKNRKLMKAHRVAFAMFRHSITDGSYVLHRCDNSKCVNPDHLFLGTQLENMQDMHKKGRGIRGSKQHLSKLNESQVAGILILVQRFGIRRQRIADTLGVNRSAIDQIIWGKTWPHVPRPSLQGANHD